MAGKQQVERKVTGKEQRRLNQRKILEAMKRIQVFKRRGEKTIAVQAELRDELDQNLLQLGLNPNPQNLQALQRTDHRLREVNRRGKLWDAEVNNLLKGLLDEFPPSDFQKNPPPSGN